MNSLRQVARYPMGAWDAFYNLRKTSPFRFNFYMLASPFLFVAFVGGKVSENAVYAKTGSLVHRHLQAAWSRPFVPAGAPGFKAQ